MTEGFGLEPSTEAIKYANNKFPSLNLKLGFGDPLPFKEKFDLAHLGFLYLVQKRLS